MMGSNYYWWGPGHFFGGPWGMVIGPIFWLLVTFAIIYVVIKFVKKQGEDRANNETPLDIIKKRYARGEIDAEEFARKKKDLES